MQRRVTTLDAQLRAGPEAVEALLLAAARPLSLYDPTRNWHGLALGAAHDAGLAFDRGDVATGLAWTRCAVAIYDALATDSAESNTFGVSSSYARIRAIRASGRLHGDPVLDPEIIVRWVRAALVYSVEEALHLSANFRAALATGAAPSRHDARKLRAIKNRLGALQHLYVVASDAIPADLRRWLEVREQLV